MTLLLIKDRIALWNFLRQDVHLHNYSIGDSDDFFWKKTAYWGLTDSEERIKSVVLIYRGAQSSTVIALNTDLGMLRDLLQKLFKIFPSKFNLHLSCGLCKAFKSDFSLKYWGRLTK